MTEPELKPLKNCPFCGYKFVEIFVSCQNIFSVRCQKCKGETGMRDTEKDALKSWNSRAPDEKYKKAIEFIKNHAESAFPHCIEARKLLRELGELNEQ